ncbi:MAG: gamma-glutamylcyclotransferase family protein, partial [Solirubrobacterales bacterium]
MQQPRPATGMTRLAVFAYGSLVSRDSFRQTLGRPPGELVPQRLEGWRRRWSTLRDNLTAEKTFARHPNGELPRWVVGLNLERTEPASPAPAPNGALIEVTDGELQRLDVRELRYDRIDVSEAFNERSGFDSVFAYTARAGHFAARPPAEAVRMAPYLRVLEGAFTALGEGEWELFLQTTEDHPGETIEPQ